MDDLQNRVALLERRLAELEQEVADLKLAREAPRREAPPPVAPPRRVEAAAPPNRPAAAPRARPQGLGDYIQIGSIRLDERHPLTNEYRHLDISLFDVQLKKDHWDQIKFKFASFKGHSYLEFRSHANWPEIFQVWPGKDSDNIGKLFIFPEAKPTTTATLDDPRDLALLKALFGDLAQIVRNVTAGINAPEEEIQFWLQAAPALAHRALQLLTDPPRPIEPPPPPKPAASAPGSAVIDDRMQVGRIRLDERVPPTGEYRHLDISLFDVKLKMDQWDRIKFKFASFKGHNYLEFRSQANSPEIFHVWPGTEADSVSKLFKIPESKTSTAPVLADARDLGLLKALFANLDLIVQEVTEGIDAPEEEIQLWRDEAQTLGRGVLQILANAPAVELRTVPTPVDPPAAPRAVASPAAPRAVAPPSALKPVAPAVAPRPAVGPTFAPKPGAPSFAPRPPIQSMAPRPLAQSAPPRTVAPSLAPRPVAPGVSPRPIAQTIAPRPASNLINDGMEFGSIRLDERAPPAGEYRHLDISVFDAKLEMERWERIKFKFANYKGNNYLEFRSAEGWPKAFHAWPGADEDAISKLFKFPDPTKPTPPALDDPRDVKMLKALLGNLNMIVRTVTTGISAPDEEIELWREEAKALAAQTLQML